VRGGRDDAFIGGLVRAIVGPSLSRAALAVVRFVGFYGLMAATVFIVLIPGWARLALLLAVLVGITAALVLTREDRRP
jgi:hypothetical protein